jgi:ABC-type Fe3+/spermidine/putrescine transport system ATPase subunit
MLKVEGLEKSYATRDGVVQAVRGVSFAIPHGKFFTLLGPSGCGKTTTLRCVAGLERPSAGRITMGDGVLADAASGTFVPAFRRDIGMVFQSYAIWPHMNVFDNVAYPLRVRRPRPPREELRARVMETLRLVGMDALAQRVATRLSGGQQQRVAFARAIVNEPKLLLLDEPLSNLDVRLREQMRFELQELVGRVAITTLYVTHDQAEALAMSDTIAVMCEGVIAQCDAPRAIYRHPANAFVASFLGAANVLEATILERHGERALAAVDGGAGVITVHCPADLGPAQRIRVVFRPEAALLRLSDVGTSGIAGVVARVNFQGATTECHVDIGGRTVRALVPPSIEVGPGARAWIELDPTHCVVYALDPAETSRGTA